MTRQRVLFRWVLALVAAALLGGCASPRRPMSPDELLAAAEVPLGADEALVVVRLNYLSPQAGGGVLTFHHDGAAELRDAALFVRNPKDWYPLFSIPTSLSRTPLVFRVKAGRLSFTQFNRGLYVGEIRRKLFTFVKPQTITYIGDMNLQNEGGTQFSVRVIEDAATVRALRSRHPGLFGKYAFSTYLLTPGE